MAGIDLEWCCGCKQKLRFAVTDRMGIEPDSLPGSR
jgi:hypothetical protein